MIVSSIQDMYFCLSETDQLSDIQIVVNIDALAEIFFPERIYWHIKAYSKRGKSIMFSKSLMGIVIH